MSKDMRSSVAIRNAQLDAVTPEADGGFVRVYGGSRPASPDVAVTVQQLLSTLSLGAPAFGAASGGVAFANAIAPDTDIADTGTATWFRVFKADGVVALWDGTVGTSNADMILDTVDLQAGAILTINSFKLTQP